MKKIAVFLGDFFWSSIPYDGIRLHQKLLEKYNVDLVMFENDIRLNKIFTQKEKFNFDKSIFVNSKNLRIIKNWNDFFTISKDYSLIISATHIAPKTRYPKNIKNSLHCPMAAWDIGGGDILTNAIHFASFFFVKASIWKKWLCDNNNQIKEKNIFVTGSPHYDPYNFQNFTRENFYKKYELDESKKSIIICPSNPGSHLQQFEENLKELDQLFLIAEKEKVEVLVKTYPNDYLFYEKDSQYSGVYHRVYGAVPQYEMLKSKFDKLTVVESQDHFSAILNCDAMFNMSGSHVSWETHFSKIISYTKNLINKPYYKKLSYVKVDYPDNIYNIHIESLQEIFKFEQKQVVQDNEFMIRVDSVEKIMESLEKILLSL